MNSQNNNRYSAKSKGPFITYIYDTRDYENISSIHITKIGQKLFQAEIDLIGLCGAGPKKKFSNF